MRVAGSTTEAMATPTTSWNSGMRNQQAREATSKAAAEVHTPR